MGRLTSEQKKAFKGKILEENRRTENYLKFTKLIAQKLSNHKHAYSFLKSLYGLYWKIVGPFHILPDFIIFGIGRAGSTSLYEGIMEHPDVHSAKIKEIYFFDYKFKRGIYWYRGHFPSVWKKIFYTKLRKKKFITGEATARLLSYPHAPKRILKIIPNVKLIAILRNPIDRAYSLYNVEVANGREQLSFEEAIKVESKRLAGEMERMKTDENYYSGEFYRKSYLFQGIYADGLKMWFDVFPKEQFLIIDFDELARNPTPIYDKIFDFLELPKFTHSKHIVYNTRKYDDMVPSTRKYLIEYFKPHNEQLYNLLGKKFDWDK